MSARERYVKRDSAFVIALQLDLETAGFTYRKWGGLQTCKPGDWIVNNDGDIYTVDRSSFERTYRMVGPGCYVKITPVWAERAETSGAVTTKEGASRYLAGDYIVYNEPGGGDGYAVARDEFERMYLRCDDAAP